MKLNRIVILGGGTSGWMAAAAFASKALFKDIEITLIESKSIGTIGVGEGSTPYLKTFMKNLGFAESQWMQSCDSTYKTGISFDNWNGPMSSYFHPFYSALDVKPAEVFFNFANARRRGMSSHIKGDRFFIAGHLANHSLIPKTEKKLPAEQEYGYHFDALKLAKLLKEYACKNKVKHITGDVKDANQDKEGNISSLILSDGSYLEGDLFIDSSGFNSFLINKKLKVPFLSFSDELINDSAVAVSTQKSDYSKVTNFTRSKALKAGWMWQIPLTSRMGNGYVYSSKYLSKKEAEKELSDELKLNSNEMKFRHFKMNVGMYKTSWRKNVLAVGLSHSFIEPLEATALMITQWTIEKFIKLMQEQNKPYENKQTELNDELTRLILGVKDYVQAHYLTSKRNDTAYWQDITSIEPCSHRLSSLLNTWKMGDDFDYFLYQNEKEMAYFRPSWYALLAGMDYRDNTLKIPHDKLTDDFIHQAQSFSEEMTLKYFNASTPQV